MGVYLDKPNREKDSVDFDGDLFSYGASSMQGWRVSQEDAHNCCEDFDTKTAFFAVYDGHGGSEVAQYTAVHFPDFIKKIGTYKEGKISQALEDAFLQFDAHLTEEEVIHKLKEIAGVMEEEVDEEEEKKEVAGLYEEAYMPIEKLLERYQGGALSQKMREMRKKDNVPSPALRGKTDGGDIKNKDNEDIKANLDEKLVNGEIDCNGDSKPEENKKDDGIKKIENENCDSKEDISKAEVKKVTSKDGSPSSGDKKQENGTVKSEEENKSTAKTDDIKQEETENKKESAMDTNNGTAESVVSTTDNSENKISQEDKNTLPDSTEADSSSSNKTVPSKAQEPGDSNGEAEVTSSSEGSGSKSAKSAGSGSSGGSGSSAGGSSGGSSGSSGSGSSSEAADSSSKAVPCSSTGRKRSGKKGVIPEEGEDESSFDEDEETTDEDSEDEEDLCEEDSEDDYEGGEFGEGEDEEEEEDEEDGTGVIFGGEEPGSDSGCTSVVALLKGNELFVANAGDSRCVVCRDGKAIDMSFDHKPEDEVEFNRIVKAGGQVTPEGRVNGGLNLSRAIGDHSYKRNADLPLKDQMITALPDVKTLKLEDKDEFMILACDGIWNSLSSQDTVNFVRDRLKGGVDKLSVVCEELFEFCLAPNTTGDGTGCDNMTCIIVRFTDKLILTSNQTEGGATKRRASSDEKTETDSSKKPKEGD